MCILTFLTSFCCVQVSSATIQAAASLFPIANEIDSAKSQWRQTAQALVRELFLFCRNEYMCFDCFIGLFR
jgi:hypothetical protein